MIKKERIPFILFALISLLSGLWAGLSRIGFDVPVLTVTPHHGAVMVGGFLGTLISLEKIIPLKNKALFLIPGLSAASVLCFFMDYPFVALVLLIVASMALTGVFMIYFLKEHSLIYILMVAGGVCWIVGNAMLLTTNFYPAAYPWWMGFSLLIITSERLELMKFLPVTKGNKILFTGMLGLFTLGIMLSFHGIGRIVSSASLVAVAVWLLRYDIVGLSIRKKDLTKFVAISLLSGYFALLLTGILLYSISSQPLGYDALVHSYFIGFVFSMIFAHGPIILPGVLGVAAKPFHWILYVWLFLLHSSWLVRVAADLYLQMDVRKLSGVVSAAAIVLYFVTMAILTIRSQLKEKPNAIPSFKGLSKKDRLQKI